MSDEQPASHNSAGPFVSVGPVLCVECPECLFTFDARHTDSSRPAEYTCAACGYSADTETSE